MSKALPSYEERLRNPSLGLINFQYIYNHPEIKMEVWHKYLFDITFKMQVNEKMITDILFKNNFNQCFKSYLARNEKTKSR